VTEHRPLRADAARNRERLLAAAVRAFTAGGPDSALEDVSLDAVAREAGVGIGTLYRHFPTREALVEAAYRSELVRLTDAAPRLLAELPPDEALRAWMDGFLDYTATKRGMADALRAVVAAGANPYATSRDQLVAAVSALLAAGAAAGLLRDDVDPLDLLIGLNGLAVVAGDPGRREQAGRLLDLLMDGLRARHGRPGSRRT
jgi:AcrR family transcriptional regulator